MSSFSNVELRLFDESSFTCQTLGNLLTLNVDNSRLVFFRQSEVVKEIAFGSSVAIHRVSSKIIAVTIKRDRHEKVLSSYFIAFDSVKDTLNFLNCVGSSTTHVKKTSGDSTELSPFDKRTDSWSAVQYFQFYSYLSQQQNMMQDYIRTSTYQRAILANASVDFRGKVVLDVGAGSGILSFFAIQAGATRVYAVEASNMATHCNTLVQANKLAGRIVVVSGKIEEITLPEPVDIIISEPMGYMLYNERMLETYVHARKFLAPHLRQPIHIKRASHRLQKNKVGGTDLLDGDQLSDEDELDSSDSDQSDDDVLGRGDSIKFEEDLELSLEAGEDRRSNRAIVSPGLMFPTVANLYIAPFSDEALFAEQFAKANFWYQQSFHGMDLTALRNAAVAEYFNQPIVDTFDIGLCPAPPCVHKVDFRTVTESQLASIDIPLHFQISTCSTVHGLAFWFDVGFLGSQHDVWLSTAPTEPLTHWYQVRCLLGTPIFCQEGQALNGRVMMRANSRQSYDVQIELIVPGSQTKITNNLDLKNPHFRYNGYPPAPPPGSHSRSPTETYYANLCLQQQLQVQTQQSTGLTVPLAAATMGTPVTSAMGAGGSPAALFALAPAAVSGSTNLMSGVGSSVFAAGTVDSNHAHQQTHLQSMQMSPQPNNTATANQVPLSMVSANAGITGVTQILDPASSVGVGLTHSLFYNPATSIMSGIEDVSLNPVLSQSANGWRAGAFTIE
ncbi:unnamed protein product [Calicophoron daubneyi]|uniref:type I protein arginine methyltransferase n=1 Tax=Calicophoron daubneyi TaxID=300641 RepID=A0AAV2TNI7_CALDB